MANQVLQNQANLSNLDLASAAKGAAKDLTWNAVKNTAAKGSSTPDKKSVLKKTLQKAIKLPSKNLDKGTQLDVRTRPGSGNDLKTLGSYALPPVNSNRPPIGSPQQIAAGAPLQTYSNPFAGGKNYNPQQ